ncbi:hypothetical protein B0A81_09640 [Flavobacterium plurextorum]|uniref:Uncharacterized protein n=1 Tax=Flavobacterium plurextorum TaxID=1114867 RepID=A0ABX4CV42_9FLAO|nr:hypothetical protein [Flavobacterium plurextorum]OXB08562.1 hypothetical protein B0A81_09640 [Flavobacterium plurextorum]
MYSQKDAFKLIEFYHDKVVGKPLDNSEKKLLITDMDFEPSRHGSGVFDVFCCAEVDSFRYQKDIDEVAESLGLVLPKNFLKYN